MNPSVFRSIFRGDGLPTQLEYLKGRVRGDASAIAWGDGKTSAVKWIPSIASDDTSLSSDIQVSGPVSARTGALVLKDGTREAVFATTWTDGDEVIVLAETTSDGAMRIGVVTQDTQSENIVESADYARGVSIFSHAGKQWAVSCNYINGLNFFDISDLSNVSLIQTETNSGFFHGPPVKIGERLFVPARESGLYVYSLINLGVSGLGTPTILTPPTGGTTPKITGVTYDATTDILYAFNRTGGWCAIKAVSTTSSGSLAWDATLKRATEAGVVNLETHRGDVLTVDEKRVLLVPSLTTNILLIDDITSGGSPTVLSYLLSSSVNYKCWDAKHLYGNLIICSNWSYETTQRYRAGLAVYDISDPYSPRLCSRWIDPALEWNGMGADSPPFDISVSEGVVYVAGGRTGLRIIDASNPYHLVEIATKTNQLRLSADHGYSSCFYRDGVVAAVGADIPTNSGPAAMDLFVGTHVRPQATPIKFYPYGGKSHYLDEFFYESGSVNDGTKNFPTALFMYTTGAIPVATGDRQFAIPLPQNERAFALLAPCKSMSAVHVKGRVSLDVLPPANGYIYCSFATTKSMASGGAPVIFLQLIMQSTADGTAYKCMVKYNNGSAVVNTSMTSASFLFTAGTIYDFDIIWSASGISLTYGPAPTVSVSGSFGAAPRPKQIGLDVSRVDTTTATAFQLTFHNRLTIHDSAIDWSHTDATLWVSDTPANALLIGSSAGVKRDTIGDVLSDGDFCVDTGKTILMSATPPYAVGTSIPGDGPSKDNADKYSQYEPFDGTFPALTDTTTIGAIDQVQVWSGHPASSIIVKVLQGL